MAVRVALHFAARSTHSKPQWLGIVGSRTLVTTLRCSPCLLRPPLLLALIDWFILLCDSEDRSLEERVGGGDSSTQIGSTCLGMHVSIFSAFLCKHAMHTIIAMAPITKDPLTATAAPTRRWWSVVSMIASKTIMSTGQLDS